MCILEILETILYRCVETRYPAVNIVVYTGDTEAAPDQILAKARDRYFFLKKYLWYNKGKTCNFRFSWVFEFVFYIFSWKIILLKIIFGLKVKKKDEINLPFHLQFFFLPSNLLKSFHPRRVGAGVTLKIVHTSSLFIWYF